MRHAQCRIASLTMPQNCPGHPRRLSYCIWTVVSRVACRAMPRIRRRAGVANKRSSNSTATAVTRKMSCRRTSRVITRVTMRSRPRPRARKSPRPRRLTSDRAGPNLESCDCVIELRLLLILSRPPRRLGKFSEISSGRAHVPRDSD